MINSLLAKAGTKKYFLVAALLLILAVLAILTVGTMTRAETGSQGLFVIAPGATDSLVVDQLLKRSISFFDSGGGGVDALDHFLAEALDIAIKNQLADQEAIIYNMVGRRLRNTAQYPDALRYHKRALKIAQTIDNPSLLADIYNQIGVVYRRVDENAMALDMHFKALEISERIKDTFNISVAINSIGNVNFNLRRFHSAIEYFRRSLALSQVAGNTLGLAINNHNIGESHLNLGYPWLALDYFYRALDYNNMVGSDPGRAICFNSIGAAYIVLEDFPLALEYLGRALAINQRLGNLLQTSVSYAKMGDVYRLIGDKELALNYLKKSFELSSSLGVRFQAEESARLLSGIYENQGEYGRALEYFKIAAAYKDTILNEKNLYHLITIETMMGVDAQQDRIDQLSRQSLMQQSTLGRQRIFLTIFVALVIALVVVLALLVYQYRLRAKYNFLKNQHKLLRSQMNPHFIFNALSSIQVYVLQHDVEKSTRFLTDFAKLMRLVLKVSRSDYITISQEAEILKYYLELQCLQFDPPFNYLINVEVPGSPEMIMVPPMITQPFVENAVEHGIKMVSGQGRLDVRFKQVDSQIIVEVEDNGIGINTSMQRKNEKGSAHESMALKITRERLDVLRNDSGGKVALDIIDKRTINPFDRGTLVRIMLPVLNASMSKFFANGEYKSTGN